MAASSKSFKELSGPEATKELLNLYILRLKRLTSRDKIEIQLIEIIASYLGQVFMRFDLCPSGYSTNIKANGTIIEYSNKGNHTPVLFGCSIGVNEGIHKWKLRIDSLDKASIKSPLDSIGIVHDIKTAAKFCTRQRTSPYYGLSLGSESYQIIGGKNINCGDNNRVNWNAIQTDTKWSVGDVITVILNCKKWKLMFKINDKLVGKGVLISVRKLYHLFVLVRSKELTLTFL